MFVCDLKLAKFSLVKKIAVAVIVFIIGVAVVTAVKSGSYPKNTTTCDELGSYSICAEAPAQEQEFLKLLGYEVETESRISESIIIPSEFNDIYNEYNELQKPLGLNLEWYKGKNAEKVTYKLKNSDKYTIILVCEGKIAGGHITNGEYGQSNLPLM